MVEYLFKYFFYTYEQLDMKRKIVGGYNEEDNGEEHLINEKILPIVSKQLIKEQITHKRISRGQIQWLIDHCKKELFYMTIAFIGIVVASGMFLVCVYF